VKQDMSSIHHFELQFDVRGGVRAVIPPSPCSLHSQSTGRVLLLRLPYHRYLYWGRSSTDIWENV